MRARSAGSPSPTSRSPRTATTSRPHSSRLGDNLDTPLHLDRGRGGVDRSPHLAATRKTPMSGASAGAPPSSCAPARSSPRSSSGALVNLARAIRNRIRTALTIETESGPLTKLMKAFQTALVHDLDEAGFADMYAQTIAYGLLSARITDPARGTADDSCPAHMRRTLPEGTDGDLPPRGWAPWQGRRARHRFRRTGRLRGGGVARPGQHGSGGP